MRFFALCSAADQGEDNMGVTKTNGSRGFSRLFLPESFVVSLSERSQKAQLSGPTSRTVLARLG
jgi:hypothetical protein